MSRRGVLDFVFWGECVQRQPCRAAQAQRRRGLVSGVHCVLHACRLAWRRAEGGGLEFIWRHAMAAAAAHHPTNRPMRLPAALQRPSCIPAPSSTGQACSCAPAGGWSCALPMRLTMRACLWRRTERSLAPAQPCSRWCPAPLHCADDGHTMVASRRRAFFAGRPGHALLRTSGNMLQAFCAAPAQNLGLALLSRRHCIAGHVHSHVAVCCCPHTESSNSPILAQLMCLTRGSNFKRMQARRSILLVACNYAQHQQRAPLRGARGAPPCCYCCW